MTANPKEYPVNTITEMAMIPRDRRLAFLVELPRLLDLIDQTKDDAVTEHSVWVDDGESNLIVNFLVSDSK